jgi:long-chain acyl-CoA synthetase
MDAPWFTHYQAGIPREINPESSRSLVEFIEANCEKYAPLPAYSCFGKTLSYGDIARLSRDFGAYLTGVVKLARGARVALMMPNVLQYPVALHGTLRAGLTVVNVNPLYTARELRNQLIDSGAEVIVILENFAHVLQQVLAETKVRTVIVTRMGDLLGFPKSLLVNTVVNHIKKMVPAYSLPEAVSFWQALHRGKAAKFVQHPVAITDIAFLQYTGGTTGVAKGAMLSHRNMLANIEQASAWLKPSSEIGREIIVTALPLYHIFSLTANCLTFMKIGAKNILITNPRDIPGFIKTLRGSRFTAITGVNTLFNALLHNREFASVDFSTLKLVLGGGMAVQAAVAEKWQKVTKVPLIQAYGLTETSPAVCINPLNITRFTGAIGLPIPSTRISIRDDNNNELPADTAGELCVKGPQVMEGYWNKPEETAEVFTADGWLKTGDIATINKEGFVTIVDRKKDIIIVSGFNVYPNEIEDVVAAHPKVLEVGAIGVQDEKSGEAVKILVVKKDESLTVDELRAYCREELTGYKVPKIIEFCTELPKTNVGKILRRSLREQQS